MDTITARLSAVLVLVLALVCVSRAQSTSPLVALPGTPPYCDYDAVSIDVGLLAAPADLSALLPTAALPLFVNGGTEVPAAGAVLIVNTTEKKPEFLSYAVVFRAVRPIGLWQLIALPPRTEAVSILAMPGGELAGFVVSNGTLLRLARGAFTAVSLPGLNFGRSTLLVESGNRVWVVDTANHCIRKVSLGQETSFDTIGNCSNRGSRDGSSDAAQFDSPGAATQNATHLFVVDRNGVRAVDKTSAATTTLLSVPATFEVNSIALISNRYGVAFVLSDSCTHVISNVGSSDGLADSSLVAGPTMWPTTQLPVNGICATGTTELLGGIVGHPTTVREQAFWTVSLDFMIIDVSFISPNDCELFPEALTPPLISDPEQPSLDPEDEEAPGSRQNVSTPAPAPPTVVVAPSESNTSTLVIVSVIAALSLAGFLGIAAFVCIRQLKQKHGTHVDGHDGRPPVSPHSRDYSGDRPPFRDVDHGYPPQRSSQYSYRSNESLSDGGDRRRHPTMAAHAMMRDSPLEIQQSGKHGGRRGSADANTLGVSHMSAAFTSAASVNSVMERSSLVNVRPANIDIRASTPPGTPMAGSLSQAQGSRYMMTPRSRAMNVVSAGAFDEAASLGGGTSANYTASEFAEGPFLQSSLYTDASMVDHDTRINLVETGSFLKIKLVGRGAYGSVYTCVLDDGSVVAVKEIGLRDDAQAHMVSEVQHEMGIVMRLIHPNIVRYYGCKYEETERKLLLFMELATGGSLGSLCKHAKNYISETVAKRYLRQVLEAIAFIHDRGVVHRDIKCDNVLLTQEGACKLGDFGTSRVMESFGDATKHASTMVGTPMFMAPEMLVNRHDLSRNAFPVGGVIVSCSFEVPEGNRGDGKMPHLDPTSITASGEPSSQPTADFDANPSGQSAPGAANIKYDQKADIWSFGIMALELLNKGNMPWPSFNNQAGALMYIASERGRPRIPRRLSTECKDFINRCVERDPLKRATAEELLDHPWLDLTVSPPKAATPQTSSPRHVEINIVDEEGQRYSPLDGSPNGTLSSISKKRDSRDSREDDEGARGSTDAAPGMTATNSLETQSSSRTRGSRISQE